MFRLVAQYEFFILGTSANNLIESLVKNLNNGSPTVALNRLYCSNTQLDKMDENCEEDIESKYKCRLQSIT